MEAYVDVLRQMLLQAMVGQHSSVAEEAFTTTCAFIVSLEVPVVRYGLVDLLPAMLNVSLKCPLVGMLHVAK